MSVRIIPAIMSGGAGTRLWPLSTAERPKQFHTLGWPEALFAATLRRVRGDTGGVSFAPPMVLANVRHEQIVREDVGADGVLVLEPEPRNTAAAAAVAAALAAEREPDALLLLLPSDHVITDAAAFHGAIARGAPFARERIVTFGIAPTRPATNYGYIKQGASLAEGVCAIEAFKEKPNRETASAYLTAGDCAWNAGIFLAHPLALLREFTSSADILEAALAALADARREGNVIRLDANAFASARSAPLDTAVMEKTKAAAVVSCDFGWADLGTWEEVWRLAPRDAEGFAILGSAAEADASKMEAAGVRAAVVHGDDLVVVAAPRGLLIAPRALVSDPVRLRQAAAAL